MEFNVYGKEDLIKDHKFLFSIRCFDVYTAKYKKRKVYYAIINDSSIISNTVYTTKKELIEDMLYTYDSFVDNVNLENDYDDFKKELNEIF